jgi:hypothetical protein
MELIGKYYGTDWLAMILAFCFLYLVGEKKRYGFVLGIFSSISWLVFAVLAHSIANVIANIIFIFLNMRGYLNWGKAEYSN